MDPRIANSTWGANHAKGGADTTGGWGPKKRTFKLPAKSVAFSNEQLELAQKVKEIIYLANSASLRSAGSDIRFEMAPESVGLEPQPGKLISVLSSSNEIIKLELLDELQVPYTIQPIGVKLEYPHKGSDKALIIDAAALLKILLSEDLQLAYAYAGAYEKQMGARYANPDASWAAAGIDASLQDTSRAAAASLIARCQRALGLQVEFPQYTLEEKEKSVRKKKPHPKIAQHKPGGIGDGAPE